MNQPHKTLYDYLVIITIELASVLIKVAEKAIFTVDGTGTVVYLQWYKDNENLEDNADISGSSTNQLTISNVKQTDKASTIVRY